MDRIIKFRGKDLLGKWRYGDLIQEKWKSRLNTNEKAFMIKKDKTACTVLENTIGQFTGFIDINKKEIYTNDIVKMHYFFENYDSATLGVYEDEAEIIGIIKINEYGTYIETKDKQIYYLVNYIQEPEEELEVIGNIIDNKDLLKEE